MSEIVIKVEDISKQYRLGKIGTGTFSHDLNRWWNSFLGKEDPYLKIGEVNDRSKKGQSDYVWALKKISFEVKMGDVLGIIGKNGAGKSTLLKILSRTTLPTTGDIKIKGRVASLLEVGTGFHPELTGRENIYLNGAILGMRKKEISQKLDEIIDFSGVERYIDTPVKRYSSGMHVRLAFAVAAHLESEILIVDEVLAVGDAEFQKKCLGKMGEVSRGKGRTVLFVSHNLKSVSELCTTGILIENGMMLLNSDIDTCISNYNKSIISNQFYKKSNNNLGFLFQPIISSVNVVQNKENYGSYNFIVEYESSFVINNPIIGIVISDEFGSPLCGFNNRFYNSTIRSSSNDIINIHVNGLYLHTGQYFVSAYLGDSLSDYYSLKDVISFSVINEEIRSTQVPSIRHIGGFYLSDVKWSNI